MGPIECRFQEDHLYLFPVHLHLSTGGGLYAGARPRCLSWRSVNGGFGDALTRFRVCICPGTRPRFHRGYLEFSRRARSAPGCARNRPLHFHCQMLLGHSSLAGNCRVAKRSRFRSCCNPWFVQSSGHSGQATCHRTRCETPCPSWIAASLDARPWASYLVSNAPKGSIRINPLEASSRFKVKQTLSCRNKPVHPTSVPPHLSPPGTPHWYVCGRERYTRRNPTRRSPAQSTVLATVMCRE